MATYASANASDRLERVREAIEQCLTSQQYSVRGRQQQQARLDSLMQLEQRLIAEVSAASQGSMTSLAQQVPVT